MKHIAVFLVLIPTALSGAGCTKQPSARIETAAPVPPPTQLPDIKYRSEPVFYNGKTYKLSFGQGQGAYAMKVSGMTAAQKKDAVAVATSSLRYFVCKDGQQTKITAEPAYRDGQWQMAARCA
jgi:hypothetical protein